MSTDYSKFYINGEWVPARGDKTLDVINPATEQAIATISLGNADDVDAAAQAARAAFDSWSQSSIEDRKAVLAAIIDGIKTRGEELASAISSEMGAPIGFARAAQVGAGLATWLRGQFQGVIKPHTPAASLTMRELPRISSNW